MTNTNTITAAPDAAVDTDPRPLMERALATAVAVVDRVTPDQHRLPTPCDGFDVEALMGHLAAALGRVAACGRGDRLGMHAELVTSADWPAELRSRAAAVVEAWRDDARLTDLIELPWATMAGDRTVRTYVNEVTVHTWDLATATDQQVEWDDDVVAAAQAAIERELPTAERAALWDAVQAGLPDGVPFAAPFADARPFGADATPIERLVAWNGR